MDSGKRNKPGRKAVSDPAIHRYSIRLNAIEHDKFLVLLRRSGQKSNTDFIKAMIYR